MNDYNRRILLIDDTPSIHEDFKKILGGGRTRAKSSVDDVRAAFLGKPGGDEAEKEPAEEFSFELDSAYQGMEGFEKVQKASEAGRPFALAFVDVRMPPGWDGIRTIKELWRLDSELQVVICTAYSDYSWSQTIEELGQSDRLLILKKPFDAAEIRQLAAAMTEKWNAARRERKLIDELRSAESQARSYASSLETMNQALMSSKASSEKAAAMRSQFLVQLSGQVHENLSRLLKELLVDRPEGLEDVLESSQHLIRTLDQILDMNQVEAGVLEITTRPTELVELVEGVLEDHREEARAHRLELSYELIGELPAQVDCDAGRVTQVLSLLVENAIGAARDGRVRIEVSMHPTSDWNVSVLRMRVHDCGPRIPEQYLGRIFEPFAYRRSGAAGTGIGLALTRQLARMMNGDAAYRAGLTSDDNIFEVSVEVGNVSGVPMIGGA